MDHDPLKHSKYMGHGSVAQVPLRLVPEMTKQSVYHIENIDKQSGYQAYQKYAAAERWTHAIRDNQYVWLGVSGAATPVGLGGLFADLIQRGLVDVVVCTGANAFHDLHYACGLPVRHGTDKVNDDKLFKDETTRIYTQFIHNKYTLKGQDMLNQGFMRNVMKKGRLNGKFSTAQLLNELGKEMLDDNKYVVDKKGSFVLRAAEYDVPIFLDSGYNHSLGMDLTLLAMEGYDVDTSPSEELFQLTSLTMHTQPQVNIFLGEGGPRNLTQTTGPTASEIYYLVFDGSDTCIRFTVADVRAGALSGSTASEAKSWGKYKDADPSRDIEVWGEYTLTFPDVAGYVADKALRQPRRLLKRLPDLEQELKDKIKSNMPNIKREQAKLKKKLPYVIKHEVELRKKAGYKFVK